MQGNRAGTQVPQRHPVDVIDTLFYSEIQLESWNCCSIVVWEIITLFEVPINLGNKALWDLINYNSFISKHSVCTRHCAKHFIYIILFTSHNSSVIYVLFSFYN